MTTTTKSRKSAQIYNIGPAENTKCLMVRLDWTTATVAHIRANKDITIEVEQVSLVKGVYTFIKKLQIHVRAGQHVYFAKSGREGYYYINTGTGCTCVGNMHFHQHCKHLEAVEAFQATQCKLEAVRKQVERCGTCGEMKNANAFTDGECNDCHFAPSMETSTTALVFMLNNEGSHYELPIEDGNTVIRVHRFLFERLLQKEMAQLRKDGREEGLTIALAEAREQALYQLSYDVQWWIDEEDGNSIVVERTPIAIAA